MNILIMSDVMPPDQFDSIYAEGRLEELLSAELIQQIDAADYNILNLECPMTTCENHQNKWGVCLKADPANVGILTRIPRLLVNLANNHLRDYGTQGVLDTLETLEIQGIPYVGAGRNEAGLKRSHILEQNEERIAIYSCCEHEFCTAEGDLAGANGCQDGDDVLAIQMLRATCDRVIVLHHGGCEFYPYPTPNEQHRLRNYVRAGADLVVCQHNHCVSAVEQYQDGTIIYGQGNWLVDHRPELEANIQNHDMWNSGMMVSYDSIANACDFLPYLRKEHDTWHTDANREVLGAMQRFSEEIRRPGFVKARWDQYCDQNLAYLRIFRGSLNRENLSARTKAREIRDILQIDEKRQRELLLQINGYLHCESHEELIQTLSRRLLDRRG